MDSTTCVEQKGIIEEINKGIATVNITSFSACASCQSKGACRMTETSEKYIEVAINPDDFKTGELVKVLMKQSLGLRATLLAYVLPFMIVLLALMVLTSLGMPEVFAGLLSLVMLSVYFVLLHFFKDKLQKTFQFTLNKVN